MGESLKQEVVRKDNDRIGLTGPMLTFKDERSKGPDGGQAEGSGQVQGKGPGGQPAKGSGQVPAKGAGQVPAKAADISEAGGFLLDWLGQREGAGPLAAVGHRIVHGLDHREPVVIDDALLAELKRISSYDPDHLPGEIGLIGQFRRHDPGLLQVACFDTAIHAHLPRVAKLLPLPRRYDEAGIQRYGFHGLSYSYILEEMTRIAGPVIAGGSVIMAHLGNGASLAAVKEGRSIDTTMGFTPTGGIMMGTRTGDLDPGVAWWLLQNERLTAAQFNDLVNHQSGLLGVSGTSSDFMQVTCWAGRKQRPSGCRGGGLVLLPGKEMHWFLFRRPGRRGRHRLYRRYRRKILRYTFACLCGYGIPRYRPGAAGQRKERITDFRCRYPCPRLCYCRRMKKR